MPVTIGLGTAADIYNGLAYSLVVLDATPPDSFPNQAFMREHIRRAHERLNYAINYPKSYRTKVDLADDHDPHA